MAKGLGLKARVAPALAAALIVAFYAGASQLVKRFPTELSPGKIAKGSHFASGYDSLLAWAALSYCALAIGAVIAAYAARQLWRPHPSFPYGIGLAVVLAGISIWLLFGNGNITVTTLEGNLCQTIRGAIQCDIITPSITGNIDALKLWLNGAFQVGATFLLVATLEVSAYCARAPRDGDDFTRACRQYDRLFLAASFLLTLIIFTDVLFLSFVRAVLPDASALVAFHNGLVVYFAVVSSMVLVLVLVAASFIGHPLAIPGLAREQLDAGREGGDKGLGGLFGTLADLLKAPSTTKTVAAFAPLLAGLLGPLLDLN